MQKQKTSKPKDDSKVEPTQEDGDVQIPQIDDLMEQAEAAVAKAEQKAAKKEPSRTSSCCWY